MVEQTRLLQQSNIYIDPAGAYQIPQLSSLKDAMSGRISTIKDNMYSLPILNETTDTKMIQVFHIIDNE